MASPTVYKWTDTGAPALIRGDSTSYQALFQACLIDGYGSKTPPGTGTNKWSIPFSDSTSFILKQGGTATRKTCIKLKNFYSSGIRCDVEAADDFSDLNTPVGQWAGNDANDRLPTGESTNNAYEIPWVIMATERGILCVFGYNNTTSGSAPRLSTHNTYSYQFPWYFGDFTPEDPAQELNQILCTINSTSNSSSYYTSSITETSTSYSKWMVAGTANNLPGERQAYPMFMRTRQYLGSDEIGEVIDNEGYPLYPNMANGGMYLERVKFISDRTIMGTIPGILYPLQSRPFPETGMVYEIPGAGDYNGSTLYVFTATGQFFVHDGEWGIE